MIDGCLDGLLSPPPTLASRLPITVNDFFHTSCAAFAAIFSRVGIRGMLCRRQRGNKDEQVNQGIYHE